MATKTLPLLLIALSLLQGILSQGFTVRNNARSTPGGQRFDRDIGPDYTLKTLREAANFVWRLLEQPNPSDRRRYDTAVNLVIQDAPVTQTRDSNVQVSARSIEAYPPGGDGARFAFASVLYHEITHVFQWTGRGTAPGALMEGIADYVVLKSPFYVKGYSAPGQGQRWDEGGATTSRFLEHCDGLRKGFTAELNKRMRDVYKAEYWRQLLGKDVDQVWREYKAKYA